MFSEPVIGERFFGRKEVIELLQKRASALKDGYRQNVALTGQSLAGKSSILHHFLYTLKETEFVAVYVEVIREPFKAFANKFIATILYSTLSKMGEDVGPDMDSLLARASELLPKTYLSIKHINSYVDKAEYDEAYSVLLGLTSTLKSEVNMSCIVILDEFDNLECLGVKNPFLNFGKVIMVQKDTMYIVSSSRACAIKKILSEKLSLLFGNFEIVKVSGFDPRTSSDYIDARLDGYEIDDMMKRFLIIFTDGNPFYLDVLISKAKEILTFRMSNYIDREIIKETILELLYNSSGTIHQYILNYLLELVDTKYRESYLSILVSIANGHNKQRELARILKTKQSEVSKGLGRLVELGLLSRNGIFHKIDDAMLEFWLRHVYQRRRALLVNGLLDKMKLFDGEVGSYLSSFVQESSRDVIVKLTELFNQFSNELVQIDSKYVRLPHFTKVEARCFSDTKPFIVATFRGRSWIVRTYEYEAVENDVIEYIKDVKALALKVSNKVVIPLRGMDENAKLLAKELKVSIWDTAIVNTLLALYGKSRTILL